MLTSRMVLNLRGEPKTEGSFDTKIDPDPSPSPPPRVANPSSLRTIRPPRIPTMRFPPLSHLHHLHARPESKINNGYGHGAGSTTIASSPTSSFGNLNLNLNPSRNPAAWFSDTASRSDSLKNLLLVPDFPEAPPTQRRKSLGRKSFASQGGRRRTARKSIFATLKAELSTFDQRTTLNQYDDDASVYSNDDEGIDDAEMRDPRSGWYV